MALLHEAFQDKKFDTRIVEKGLVRGLVSQAELEAELKKLPDDSENADWVAIDSFDDSIEDDDQNDE